MTEVIHQILANLLVIGAALLVIGLGFGLRYVWVAVRGFENRLRPMVQEVAPPVPEDSPPGRVPVNSHGEPSPANPQCRALEEEDVADLNELLRKCLEEGSIQVIDGEVKLYPDSPTRIELLLDDD